jgi:hypothetical protein
VEVILNMDDREILTKKEELSSKIAMKWNNRKLCHSMTLFSISFWSPKEKQQRSSLEVDFICNLGSKRYYILHVDEFTIVEHKTGKKRTIRINP